VSAAGVKRREYEVITHNWLTCVQKVPFKVSTRTYLRSARECLIGSACSPAQCRISVALALVALSVDKNIITVRSPGLGDISIYFKFAL